jgi:hypothetical protein
LVLSHSQINQKNISKRNTIFFAYYGDASDREFFDNGNLINTTFGYEEEHLKGNLGLLPIAA